MNVIQNNLHSLKLHQPKKKKIYLHNNPLNNSVQELIEVYPRL